MRTSLVRRGATAAAVAAVLGLATAYNFGASLSQSTDVAYSSSAHTSASKGAASSGTYLLMVKPPETAHTRFPVRAVELSLVPPHGTESGGKEKRLGGCIRLAPSPTYTNTHLHVRRGDAIEAQMFTKCQNGEGHGNVSSAVLWGAKPQNIKGHKIFFNLDQ
jgi:hypothetical protein